MSLYQHLKREKEVADYVSATSPFLYPIINKKSRPLRSSPKRERGRSGVRPGGKRGRLRP